MVATIMAIPDYQALMLPLLQLAADGEEHKFRTSVEKLADLFKLTEDERAELLPSGGYPLFDNRVGWARTYLKKAGLLQSPKRGVFLITDRGRGVLEKKPERIDTAFLEQFREFRDFRTKRRSTTSKQPRNTEEAQSTDSQSTPEDSLALAYRHIRNTLESDLLEQVKLASPAFFERLVVDLLVKMGYGGSRQDAGRAIGRSGDGGIDGIINEDRLGLDVIFLQAKRWDNVVGRPEIQKFAGALQGQRAKKGVFITTSNFSREAREYASFIDTPIVLIDGDRLVSLMVDHDVGVSTTGTYELKKIDSDYFDGQ
jgi:restriction system protein